MPYKDKNSPAAIASRKRGCAKWYAKNRDRKCEKKRANYAANPAPHLERNKRWKGILEKEKRCVNCGKARDRGNKVLCSICAPIHNDKVKKNTREYKTAAFNAYGGPVCACCGDAHFDFMSIDHIGGGGAAHRKELRKGDGFSGGGGLRTYLWLKRNNYPPGFRVLCRNCNSAMGELGYCPHERERLNADSRHDI